MNNYQSSLKASYSVPLSATFSTLPILWKNSLNDKTSGLEQARQNAYAVAQEVVDALKEIQRENQK